MAANCRVFLELCKAKGLKPMIAGTVRDDAYQLDRYNKGYSKSKRPSFHAQGVGLAFDFCKNVPGHEYDDPAFFQQCGAIGEAMGFEWGGRWVSFPDRPHAVERPQPHLQKQRHLGRAAAARYAAVPSKGGTGNDPGSIQRDV